MEEFARNGRLTEAECVLPRYMAVHVMEPQVVYAHVGSDYELLKLKAMRPPLSEYRDIDVKAFVQGARTIDVKAGGDEFKRFCATVVPRPVDEEQWYSVTRKGQWAEGALFLIAGMKDIARPAHLKRLVEAVGMEHAYEPLKKYAFKDTVQAAREMGALIATVKDDTIVNMEAIVLEEEEPKHEHYGESADYDIVLVPHDPPSIETFRTEMEDFRRRNHLNATVSTQRLAAQMVFLAAGFEGGAHLLARGQERIEPLQGDHEREVALKCVDAVCTGSWNPAASHCASTVARRERQYKWTSPDLVRAAITRHPSVIRDVEFSRVINAK